MEEDLISVLVVAYNVSDYISKCLDSIINQTYKNIEIIIVNDGSTDETKNICDYYGSIDNRIKVIHKENEGVATARNTAIKNSKGKYISFVDSDDFILSDYIEYLYYNIKKYNADIINCNFEYYYENKSTIKRIKPIEEKIIEFNKKEALQNLLYQKELDVSPWAKLYKIDVFNNVEYPKGKIYEDFGTFYKNIINSNKIIYSNQKKYYYFIRKTSTTGRNFKKEDFDMIELSKIMKKEILTIYPDLENAINSRLINMDFYFIRRIDKKLYPKQYKLIKDDIKLLRKKVLKDKKIKFKVKAGIYISYIKIDLIRVIYNIIKKIKLAGISDYLTKYKG